MSGRRKMNGKSIQRVKDTSIGTDLERVNDSIEIMDKDEYQQFFDNLKEQKQTIRQFTKDQEFIDNHGETDMDLDDIYKTIKKNRKLEQVTDKFIAAIVTNQSDTVRLPFNGAMKSFKATPFFRASVLNSLIYVHKNKLLVPGEDLNSTIGIIMDVYESALKDVEAHQPVAQGFMHIIEHVIKPQWGIDLDNPALVELLDRLKQNIQTGRNESEGSNLSIGAAHAWYFIVRGAYERGYDELFKQMYKDYTTLFLS